MEPLWNVDVIPVTSSFVDFNPRPKARKLNIESSENVQILKSVPTFKQEYQRTCNLRQGVRIGDYSNASTALLQNSSFTFAPHTQSQLLHPDNHPIDLVSHRFSISTSNEESNKGIVSNVSTYSKPHNVNASLLKDDDRDSFSASNYRNTNERLQRENEQENLTDSFASNRDYLDNKTPNSSTSYCKSIYPKCIKRSDMKSNFNVKNYHNPSEISVIGSITPIKRPNSTLFPKTFGCSKFVVEDNTCSDSEKINLEDQTVLEQNEYSDHLFEKKNIPSYILDKTIDEIKPPPRGLLETNISREDAGNLLKLDSSMKPVLFYDLDESTRENVNELLNVNCDSDVNDTFPAVDTVAEMNEYSDETLGSSTRENQVF